MNPFALLFDTADFPARWHCGRWTELHGWVHIVSDAAIFFAYAFISSLLLILLVRRERIPFPRILALFVAFIACCGLTHLNEAVIFWQPVYRWAGLVKLITALISVGTAFAMVLVIPQVQRLRTPAELEQEVERRTSMLQQSNADLESFAYVASHDLKAPLRAVDNLSAWLEEDLADRLEPDEAEKMELLRGRVRRMEMLLDDLLSYSRASRAVHDIQEVNVGELVAELCQTQLELPAGFTLELSPDLPTLSTARIPLEQVFRNLISNAVKHHDRGEGRIEVSWAPHPHGHAFSVRDDGPGIPAEQRERVFGLFKTLRPRDEVEGSGIGLSLVQRLVKRYFGEVSIEDAEPGARVTFTWPATIEPESPVAATGSAARPT